MECEVDVKIGQVEAKGGKRKPRGVRRKGRRAKWPGRRGANLRPRCFKRGQEVSRLAFRKLPENIFGRPEATWLPKGCFAGILP